MGFRVPPPPAEQFSSRLGAGARIFNTNGQTFPLSTVLNKSSFFQCPHQWHQLGANHWGSYELGWSLLAALSLAKPSSSTQSKLNQCRSLSLSLVRRVPNKANVIMFGRCSEKGFPMIGPLLLQGAIC